MNTSREERTNLAIDLGGTNLRLGVLTADLAFIAKDRLPTTSVATGAPPIEALTRVMRNFLDEYDVPLDLLSSISFGVPSTVDRRRRTILSTSNIPRWSNVPAADLLEKEFGVPVILERDTNFLMASDMYVHDVANRSAVIGVYVGTGLGNSVVIDGNIYSGAHGVSAELGHIPVKGSTMRCGCGLVGCLEPLASGLGLKRIHREGFASTPFDRIWMDHDGHPDLEEFLDYLAIAVATEVNIIDPSIVILGGGVIAMDRFPRSKFESYVISHTRRPLPAEDLTFLYSDNCQFNGLRGGTIMATELLLNSATF